MSLDMYRFDADIAVCLHEALSLQNTVVGGVPDVECLECHQTWYFDEETRKYRKPYVSLEASLVPEV